MLYFFLLNTCKRDRRFSKKVLSLKNNSNYSLNRMDNIKDNIKSNHGYVYVLSN